MKYTLIIISFFIITLPAFSQQDSSYQEMISKVSELQVGDSLTISTANWQLYQLDSNNVKKWFSPLLGTGNNNRLKNRNYFITGRISGNTGFDLLLILEEKLKSDSGSRVLHFITTKKEGNYIAHFEAAVNGKKRNSSYDTRSLLFPDHHIRKTELITVNGKTITTVENFRINNAGRFIQTD
jgi:hypothetical protein